MIQNIITAVIVIVSVGFLYYKFVPRWKKNVPSHLPSSNSTNCGCGSSCPLSKK